VKPRTAAVPLPAGFRVVFDPGTKQLDDSTLFGGSPARVMRLSATGRRALKELRSGPVASAAAGTLARRLSDAGLLHPRPPAVTAPIDATVIIPVWNRTAMLARCLASLNRSYPVIVVDDGSDDSQAVAAVAATYGATVVHRAHNGGAAAARNTGLAHVTSEFVVMVDSDCVAVPGWIDQLSAHFADPLVAAVAPRIVALPTNAAATTAVRYNSACSSLDLGDREARVAPLTAVAYVPTAALIARRAALLDIAHGANIFDPAMHCGEDVDLVWRLHKAGWRIRYDPAVTMQHHEPRTWTALLSRRFHYGTSAAPLARRHPADIAPLILHPWPAIAVTALLARRPTVAGLGYAASVVTMTNALRRAGLPARGVMPAMFNAVQQTWLGLGRYGVQFAAPLLAAAVVVPGSTNARRRWGRRIAAASLLLGPGLHAWHARRPPLDPARFVLAQLADDIAYGAGVWVGCARNRTLTPVRPVISRRPLGVDPPTHRPPNPTVPAKEPS
jgi:mycofactocin system glycosyltransferase